MIVATPTSTLGTALATPTPRAKLLVPGLIAGVAASVATTTVVLIFRAAGDDVAIAGEQIPVVGFAQFVMLGALIGIALARAFSRRATRPRSTFVRTTMALAALSIVPDLVIDASGGTKLVLILTHVIAAAVIIPTLSTRLARHA